MVRKGNGQGKLGIQLHRHGSYEKRKYKKAINNNNNNNYVIDKLHLPVHTTLGLPFNKKGRNPIHQDLPLCKSGTVILASP